MVATLAEGWHRIKVRAVAPQRTLPTARTVGPLPQPPPIGPAHAAGRKAVEIASKSAVYGDAVVEAVVTAACAVVARHAEQELSVCGPLACHGRRQGA